MVMIGSLVSSDHESGLLLYRGYTLDQLWGADFEEMFHLLFWGTYPTAKQSEELRQRLAWYMQEVPDIVRQTVVNLPYVAVIALGKIRLCSQYCNTQAVYQPSTLNFSWSFSVPGLYIRYHTSNLQCDYVPNRH